MTADSVQLTRDDDGDCTIGVLNTRCPSDAVAGFIPGIYEDPPEFELETEEFNSSYSEMLYLGIASGDDPIGDIGGQANPFSTRVIENVQSDLEFDESNQNSSEHQEWFRAHDVLWNTYEAVVSESVQDGSGNGSDTGGFGNQATDSHGDPNGLVPGGVSSLTEF